MLRPVPTPSIQQALQAATERLSRSSDAAASDAAELLSRLVGSTRADLRLRGHQLLVPDTAEQFDAWVERRARGEPVAYVTGRAAFRDLDLAVTPDVLIPRPETEGLVEAVLGVLRDEAPRWPRPRVLDLGTGSGAIALAIATEWPQAIVTATDASEAALAVARANAGALGLGDRVRFSSGPWFEAVDPDDHFEVVVSNPPYIATHEWDELPRDVREWEPALALFSGESGMEALREIVDDATRHLVARGLLALELAEERAAEVEAWLEGARDWAGVRLLDDLSGRPRVALARRESGPAIAPAQWEEER